MRGAYFQYLRQKGDGRTSPAVEEACAKQREEAETRLARIQNGKHPDYQNGHPKDEEKGRKQ